MTLTILHNPRCSKSRQTLALIEQAGITPKIIKYLDNPPTKAELKTILEKLGFETPQELMRKGEAIYKELGLKNEIDPDKLIDAMIAHPKLIERPIVQSEKDAILGRPPENVNKLLRD